MAWSEQTMQALEHWLGPETWYKRHPIDDARFHVFIASVWNDEHRIWDEVQAREIIRQEARRLHPGSDQLAAQVAEKRVTEGTTILDFLWHLREEKRFGLLTK